MSESTACSLITGASSGIGAALARGLAAEGRPLVLVARRLERLTDLATCLLAAHGIRVEVIALDLATPEAVQQLLAELAARQLVVHTLVNNAGFGLRGGFQQATWPEVQRMLQLMVEVPTQLMQAVLPGMQAAQQGRILNVASLAGLIPGLPGSCLYSASKAYLIRLSQSLAAENRSLGIRVMVLCPGYVHTEFHAVLGVEERMRRLPALFWMESAQVADRALKALDGSRVVVVPGLINKVMAALAMSLPEPLAVGLSSRFSRRYRTRASQGLSRSD
ncbi:MAG: SDR family oxidoreductase [Cyanobacteria bacterium M_surface_10_m1_298]|nr:SDR family oxidoreductase [Cyanobacteria bacterium M_surface_10_m1_298]